MRRETHDTRVENKKKIREDVVRVWKIREKCGEGYKKIREMREEEMRE